MQERPQLDKIVQVSNMLENENGFDLSNSSGIQSYSHLDIPTKYQYLTNATILIPMGKLLDTTVDIEY